VGAGWWYLRLDPARRLRGTRVDGGDAQAAALLQAAERYARARGCARLRLITTNDNLEAVRWYQRRGLRIAAVYPGAVEAARRIKPQIPPPGAHGIPVRDEVELVKEL
jgi:ribosomal protein S18 acetylase RimI-like enzyme